MSGNSLDYSTLEARIYDYKLGIEMTACRPLFNCNWILEGVHRHTARSALLNRINKGCLLYTSRQRSLDEEALPPEHGPRRAEPLGADTALAVKRLDELHASVDALSRRFETWQNGVGDRSDQMLVLMRQIETLHRQIDETSRGEHPAVSSRFDDLRGQVEGLSLSLIHIYLR